MNEDSIHRICILCEERRGTGGICTVLAMFLNCGTASRECILVDLRLYLFGAVAHEDGATRDAGTHLAAVSLCHQAQISLPLPLRAIFTTLASLLLYCDHHLWRSKAEVNGSQSMCDQS